MSTQTNPIEVGNYITSARPRITPVFTDASLATVMTAGWLNSVSVKKFYPGDIVEVYYAGSSNAFFTLSFSASGVITLSPLQDISSVTDYQQFLGITDIIMQSAGTWTKTRVAEADYALVKTAAADTSIVSFDITPQLRAAAGKGFELMSIDVVSKIGTLALNAHSATLDSIQYANNVANAVVSAPLTGTLPTATQTNPYVTNLVVTTPGFFNAAVAKYVFELTVNAAASSTYSLYGVNLHFTKTVA